MCKLCANLFPGERFCSCDCSTGVLSPCGLCGHDVRSKPVQPKSPMILAREWIEQHPKAQPPKSGKARINAEYFDTVRRLPEQKAKQFYTGSMAARRALAEERHKYSKAIKDCKYCTAPIRIVLTQNGWKPVNVSDNSSHYCHKMNHSQSGKRGGEKNHHWPPTSVNPIAEAD